MFKDFLWGKKPPEFQQEILEIMNTFGGLRLIYYNAQKASWYRRIYQKDKGWTIFPIIQPNQMTTCFRHFTKTTGGVLICHICSLRYRPHLRKGANQNPSPVYTVKK